MRLLFLFLSVLVFGAKLLAQCPGNGYSSSTELVKNGDFSQGNLYFSSSYTYCNSSNCIGFAQGKYTIGKEAADYSAYFFGKDHTTGSEEFFIGTGDGYSGSSVWCQTMRVKPHTNYVISAWFSNLNVYGWAGTASLQFAMGGGTISSSFNVPSDTGKWEQHEIVWNSGTNSSASFCILNTNTTPFYGLGFGIDDISFKECLCNYPAKANKDTTICAGDSAALKASYGAGYIWSPTQTLSCTTCNNPYAKPTVTTNYFVAVTDTSTCLSTAVVKVNVIPLPKPKISGDTFLCNGTSGMLKVSVPNAKYYWSTGSTDSFTIITKPGKYWVDATVKGCNGRDIFTVTEINTVFSLGKDTTLCDGTAYTLNIPKTADTITWQDGSHNKSFIVTNAGKYWATLKTRNCSFTDSVNIKYKPNPVVNIGNDLTLCEGEKITLDAGNTGAAYFWSTGKFTQTIEANKAGRYWVKVTSNGCSQTDTITIKLQPPFTVNLGKDTTLCEGNAIKLDPKNPVWVNPEFIWSDGATTQSNTITKAGKYWIKVRSGACTATDTINIYFKPRPKVNLGKDISVCADKPVILGQSIFADKYIWNTGDTTQTILVTKAGNYILLAEINGCTATDTINVNFLQLPLFSLGNDTVLCEGQNLLLHIDVPNVSYLWQDGFLSPYSTINKTGTYWARADNGTCTYTDTIHVKYNPYPKVELGEDTLLCPGEKFLLNAEFPNATYFWNDSTTSGVKEISAAGKYWVRISLGNCSASDTINVFYKDSAKVNLGKDTTFCGVESWQLDAGNPGAEYSWNTGEKTRYINVNKAGMYWAKATFCGQTSTDTISLGFINYLPESLLMPNAFTPNKDFINDTLNAVGIDNIEAFEWRIYNRWGELVFRTNDIKNGWDGFYKNVPAPVGLYHWELSLRSPCLKNKDMARKGIVHLIR